MLLSERLKTKKRERKERGVYMINVELRVYIDYYRRCYEIYDYSNNEQLEIIYFDYQTLEQGMRSAIAKAKENIKKRVKKL